MNRQKAVAILIRAARRCPDEQDGLLEIAEALASGGLRVSEEPAARPLENVGGIDFPLEIFMDTPKDGRKFGSLNANGSVDVGSVSHTTVSNAATSLLGYSENGWRVWKFLYEGQEKPIDTLRDMGYFDTKRRRAWG